MIDFESPNTLSIKDISSKSSTEKQTFNFNHIVGPDKTQDDLFEIVKEDIVNKIIEGKIILNYDYYLKDIMLLLLHMEQLVLVKLILFMVRMKIILFLVKRIYY